jgi:hypothetical protein
MSLAGYAAVVLAAKILLVTILLTANSSDLAITALCLQLLFVFFILHATTSAWFGFLLSSLSLLSLIFQFAFSWFRDFSWICRWVSSCDEYRYAVTCTRVGCRYACIGHDHIRFAQHNVRNSETSSRCVCTSMNPAWNIAVYGDCIDQFPAVMLYVLLDVEFPPERIYGCSVCYNMVETDMKVSMYRIFSAIVLFW